MFYSGIPATPSIPPPFSVLLFVFSFFFFDYLARFRLFFDSDSSFDQSFVCVFPMYFPIFLCSGRFYKVSEHTGTQNLCEYV